MTGVRCGRLSVQDLEEAEAWLRKAAEAGGTPGQILLGLTLLQREDLDEAEALLRKAVKGGNQPVADWALGLVFWGRDDLEEAEAWLRKAVEAGYGDAETTLKRLLEKRSRADTTG